MRIDIITLFPEFFEGFKEHSIVGRAVKTGKVEIVVHNLRDQASDNYGSVDDRPYGGGPGMVLRFDVLLKTLQKIRSSDHSPNASLPAGRQGSELEKSKVILLTPQGRVYKQELAQELSKKQNLILICGHYEGFDERIREYVDQEISIGDYVLTGGELAAMVLTDSMVRLLPGVLGDETSSHDESHADGLLEYPQYTRPAEYDGKKVPEILLSGNHKEIEAWRREQARERTKLRRPDLIKSKKT